MSPTLRIHERDDIGNLPTVHVRLCDIEEGEQRQPVMAPRINIVRCTSKRVMTVWGGKERQGDIILKAFRGAL